MTNTIGQALKTAIGGIIPLYLYEAETESYPYAVYDLTSTEYFDKDGRVYKITGEVGLDVVAKDFGTAQAKVDAIKAAIADLGPSHRVGNTQALTPECVEGVWILSLQFTIIQHS